MHYVLAISVVTLYIYLRFGKKPLALIVTALAIAALFKGLILIAVPLLIFVYYLTKGERTWLAKKPKNPQQENETPGHPTITSRYLGLTLSAKTGKLKGWVRNGPNKGAHLEELTQDALNELKTYYEVGDKESAAFLYAYLDQTHPAWRSAEHPTPLEDSTISAAPLTKAQARAALGLSIKASADEIKQAHRALMKKFHPDQGGAEIIAAKLNMAKDELLA